MPRVYPQTLLQLPLPSGLTLSCQRLGQAGSRTWLALHGGPGSGASPALWQGFDLSLCQVMVPDQRGSGDSKPAGCLRGQRLGTLIDDLERLRLARGLTSWAVMGGSWGATLALLYAARYPDAVEALVLRGSFRGSRREVTRLLRRFWPHGTPVPDADTQGGNGLSLRHLRPTQVNRLLHRLSQLFRNGTVVPAVERIAHAWQTMEQAAALQGARKAWLSAGSTAERRDLRRHWQSMRPARLQRRIERPSLQPDRFERRLWQKYRIQSHHLAHRCGLRPGDWEQALRIVSAHGIPVTWIHGRHDAVCPPTNSIISHRNLSIRGQAGQSRLVLTRAGHLGGEPGNLTAIRNAARHRQG